MPYVDNHGTRIHYVVEGQGPALLLHHGLSGSLESWDDYGYIDALKPDYQLILIDARGHGASGKPHDPELYGPQYRVGDVTAVLDDLDVKRTHFFGYSYGGRVGLEVAKYAPERVRSMIIGGFGPKAIDADKPSPLLESLKAGTQGLLADYERYGPVPPDVRKRVLANDMEALAAVMTSYRPSLEHDLPSMTPPFLVFVGERDGLYPHEEVKESFKRVPNGTVVTLPALDHSQCIARRRLVLPHITDFLARVSAY